MQGRGGVWLGRGMRAGLACSRAAGQGAWVAIRDGLFPATSLITTSGFEVRNASFEIFPIALVAILLAVGAASFSTAGGIKLFRIGSMLVQAHRELTRLIYPHGIRPSRLGGQPYDIQVMKAIWSGFLAFILAAVALSLLLASTEIPYEGAMLAALSALSNAGPVYASDWAAASGWPSYGEMDTISHLGLCFGMILGRLEVVAALGLAVYVIRRG